MSDWHARGTVLIACNCDWGCPCNVNGRPTHGDCEGGWLWLFDDAQVGGVSLTERAMAVYADWPGAIHEGRGEGQLIIDEKATEDQQRAVNAIFRGEETEPGATVFNVFSNTIDTYHDSVARPIAFEADIGGRAARFSVPGIVEAASEPIKNPVTGAPHRVRVVLPHGFEYHEAEYASSTVRTQDASIPLEWSSAHAHLARVTWTPQGVAHA
jgi:hypothetical protein